MGSRLRIASLGAGLAGLIAALWWVQLPASSDRPHRPAQRVAPSPDPARPVALSAPAVPTPGPLPGPLPGLLPGTELPAPDRALAAADGHEHPPDPDLAEELHWYEENPLSSVPHAVVRGWGARPAADRRGVVGLYVVVDPNLPTSQLEQLARDIRDHHEEAQTLSARIVDSEEAATYDWHIDAREYLHRHLVATVRRNVDLEVDSIEIRGVALEP